MPEATQQTTSLNTQCQRIIDRLDKAVELHPREIETDVDEIQRDVVRLRDGLIDRLRTAERSPVSGARHAALEGVNTALSLVVAVEYPVTSIQRSALEQARQKMKELLAEGGLDS